jgi:hypothetical protein
LDQFVLNRRESVDSFRSNSPESVKLRLLPATIAVFDPPGRTLVS